MKGMIHVLVKWIITENSEATLIHWSTTKLETQIVKEFGNGTGTIKAHYLISVIGKMHW